MRERSTRTRSRSASAGGATRAARQPHHSSSSSTNSSSGRVPLPPLVSPARGWVAARPSRPRTTKRRRTTTSRAAAARAWTATAAARIPSSSQEESAQRTRRSRTGTALRPRRSRTKRCCRSRSSGGSRRSTTAGASCTSAGARVGVSGHALHTPSGPWPTALPTHWTLTCAHRIPPHMKPMKLKQMLSAYGETLRVYCTPEDPTARRLRKQKGGNTGACRRCALTCCVAPGRPCHLLTG